MSQMGIPRVLLLIAGLCLVGAALLPGQTAPAGAAPLMLVTETSTGEPPTRTPTEANTATATSIPTATATGDPTATATATQPPTLTPTAPPPPTETLPPDREPPPTATPEPSLTPTATPILVADPAIVKSSSRSVVAVGDSVEFTLTVTNRGNQVAAGVVVEDTLPAFLALEGVTATRGDVSVDGATIRVVIGDLAPGETVEIRITARVVASAIPPNNTNVGTVRSDSPGDDPDNNTSTVTLTTESPPATAVPPPPPSRLPATSAAGGLSPLALASLGLGLIALSLLLRRR